MNDIKHLKCLSAVRSMAAVRQLTPAAYPGVHCPMHTALALAANIRGVSTLLIGTAECGYYSRNVPLSSPYGRRLCIGITSWIAKRWYLDSERG